MRPLKTLKKLYDEESHIVITEKGSPPRVMFYGEDFWVEDLPVGTRVIFPRPPLEGVPYEQDRGRFANSEGVIGDGLYCVGWARRGPTGTIGTNRPDGYEVAEKIAADIGAGGGKEGRPGLDRLLAARGADVVTFRDWQKIEEAEAARAREGNPREKFVAVADMLGARGARRP